MRESELLTREACRAIFNTASRAARSAGVQDIEVLTGGKAAALTRFANNTIHQNVAERSRYVSVRVVIDQRTARATTNRLDDDSIRSVVEQAITLTRASEPDAELLALTEPEQILEADRYCDRTATSGPVDRARAVAEAIGIVESASQTAAGIYSTDESVQALLNSRGVFAYHTGTVAHFSITAMADDSSGWAKASSVDCGAIHSAALARRASEKAARSRVPREVSPGHYTVVLEPAAVLDLTGQMIPDFSATAITDQRSFLCNRIGEKLFGDNITIHDDVFHPLQAGEPFDGEGVPRRRLTLVESGIPREIAFSRFAALRAGAQPTGHGFPLPNEVGEAPANVVFQGGDVPIEQMIASTPRGILVTRLWYIREVDPYEKIMTGMTRDGTFLIENGEVVCGLKNFRFNQGLIDLLSNVESLSPAVRASGEECFDMVAPAMKVRDFNFTEVTRF
jgi:predicted Zn-dependent protease